MANGSVGNSTEARLLFLHAQTPLHPGSGTALGVVDLPVQRERHTDWPLVPGTALKGILRDACRPADGSDQREQWVAVFGPEQEQADKHAGALVVTDARLLAFPVRSLRGVFAWTTCPSVLRRLARDVSLAGGSAVEGVDTVPEVGRNQALCNDGSPLLLEGGELVLEEFEFQRTGPVGTLADWLAENAVADEYTRSGLKERLVVLSDDDFTHFARHATEVVARIGLDAERKTVKKGALFYQEFLPTETLLYSVVLANASRSQSCRLSAEEVAGYVEQRLPQVLQVGGDETTGKGLCGVRLVKV